MHGDGGDTQIITKVQIKTEVYLGEPVDYISGLSKRPDVDLIVMGSKGIHNLTDRLFGSVAAGVAKAAYCPVLILHNEYPGLE